MFETESTTLVKPCTIHDEVSHVISMICGDCRWRTRCHLVVFRLCPARSCTNSPWWSRHSMCSTLWSRSAIQHRVGTCPVRRCPTMSWFHSAVTQAVRQASMVSLLWSQLQSLVGRFLTSVESLVLTLRFCTEHHVKRRQCIHVIRMRKFRSELQVGGFL